jgi:hypothetical protein
MLFNLSFLLPNIRSRLYRERSVIVKVDVSILMWREIQMTLLEKRREDNLFCCFFAFDAWYGRTLEMEYSETCIHNG